MSFEGVDQPLIDAACAVRQHAHAPYSSFKVGAALRLADGQIVLAVNLENASYGLTVCAERNAVATAAALGAKVGDVMAVAIAAHAAEPTPPCGACRQVLAEYLSDDVPIYMFNVRDGAIRTANLNQLLPNAFRAKSLP